MASLHLQTCITPKKVLFIAYWSFVMKLKKMYPLSFFMLFSDHLQYKHYYCTLYSLTCSTIKKSITLVHIWQTGMPHSAAYYCVTRRHSLHWHRINCYVICSTVWLKKETGFSHNWTDDKKIWCPNVTHSANIWSPEK